MKRLQHFIKSGSKRIALVTTEAYFNVSESRKIGYSKALQDNGFENDEVLVLTLAYNVDNEGLIEDFFRRNSINAVLCVNEIFAIQCMSVVQKLGFVVPDDISIIGFTDGLLSKFSNPRLSTVAQHGDEMGEKAAKLLIDRIEGEHDNSKFKTEIVKATLIKRGSTIN